MSYYFAGRQLDVCIAEEVMGWERFDDPSDDVKRDLLPEYPDEWYRRPDGGWENATNVPRYSSDISAAWEVMEWLAENEYKADLTVWCEPGVGRWFACRVTEVYPDFDEWQAQSDSPAETICRAALRAVRGEET